MCRSGDSDGCNGMLGGSDYADQAHVQTAVCGGVGPAHRRAGLGAGLRRHQHHCR